MGGGKAEAMRFDNLQGGNLVEGVVRSGSLLGLPGVNRSVL